MNKFFLKKKSKLKIPILNLKRDLIGLNVSLKGRLKNANRSQKLRYNMGRIKKNTLNIFTHASKHNINTKTGVWMLRIYLLRSINDKKV